MGTESITNVRPVTCPKCQGLLLEWPELDIYNCGGCGTTLQAKRRVNDDRIRASSLSDMDADKINQPAHASVKKEPTSSSNQDTLPNKRECSLLESNGGYQHTSSEDTDADEQLGGIVSPRRDLDNGGDQKNNCSDCETGRLEVTNEACSSTSEGKCLEVAQNDESTLLADTSTTKINEKCDSDFRSSSSAVNLGVTEATDPTASADHKLVRESISTNVLVSSPSTQLLQTQSVNHDSGNVQPVEALETSDLDHSSELSDAVKDMNKSSTTDILVSSPILQTQSVIHDSGHVKTIEKWESTEFDPSSELSDAIKNVNKFPTTRRAPAYKVTHAVHLDEKPRRYKYLMKSSMSTDSEIQHEPQNSWSDKRSDSMKRSKWDPEYLQPTRRSHVEPNWSGSERDEYQPQMASRPLGTRSHYESGGPSNQLHDRFHRLSSYQSSNWPEDSEENKMKLMRMVFELQDQINKTLFLQGKGNNGVPGPSRKAGHNPRYHNYQALGDEVFLPPNYPRHPGRHGVGSSYSEQLGYMQIPFSGETSHQLYSFCLHCCPQDRKFSAQLPLYVPRKNDKLYKIHPDQSYYTSFSSCPSSPQQFLDPELPHWRCETKFNDRRCKSQETRNLAKQHFRPLAGAAPFLTCYTCFHLLQLPADFVLFKRKIHSLRCGACSEVLKFSFKNRYHIVPYTLTTDPPKNRVEDYTEAADRRILASSSEANDYSHVDSGDSDQTHYRSCSKGGGDPSSFKPSHNLQGSINDRKVQYSSFRPTKDRKELFSGQPQSIYRQSVLRYQKAGASMHASRLEKLSSEIEDLPQRSSSPLHRLLGYSSPRELLYVSRPDQESTAESVEKQD